MTGMVPSVRPIKSYQHRRPCLAGSAGQYSGQYMVEFGMTFIFFIFIVLAVINLILTAYNFNVAQRTSWEMARMASVGATNAQLADVLYDRLITKIFASPFMVSKIEFDKTNFVLPNDAFQRTQGKDVIINLVYKAGFSFMSNTGGLYARFPVTTKLIMVARNDEDRDGLYDTTSAIVDAFVDARVNDHDNDGKPDVGSTASTDTDRDADDIADINDTGILEFTGGQYKLNGPTLAGGGATAGFVAFATIADGRFFDHPMQRMSNGQFDSGPWMITSQFIPRDHFGVEVPLTTYVDLSEDKDNDGWEDKFDAFPTDATRK